MSVKLQFFEKNFDVSTWANVSFVKQQKVGADFEGGVVSIQGCDPSPTNEYSKLLKYWWLWFSAVFHSANFLSYNSHFLFAGLQEVEITRFISVEEYLKCFRP